MLQGALTPTDGISPTQKPSYLRPVAVRWLIESLPALVSRAAKWSMSVVAEFGFLNLVWDSALLLTMSIQLYALMNTHGHP